MPPATGPAPRIVVAGAGAIGCFCGGLWAAGGHPVTLLGRRRVLAPVRDGGLRLSDYAGLDVHVPAEKLELSEDPAALARADLVVVAVKGSATEEMAGLIAAHAPAAAPVLSFQNGTGNAAVLRRLLPGRDVRAAMVPFNVVPGESGACHRATSGDVVIEAGPGGLARRLSVSGLRLRDSRQIEAVQWGKLLINLGNALNALSGLALHTQLRDRGWRRLMADQMAEALGVLRASGIRPVSMTPLPAWMIPHVLRLPTPVFTRVAAQMLVIDPKARSSMAQDLMQGRPTEIAILQGEILLLAERHGLAAPLNRAAARAVAEAEAAGQGMPGLTPKDIRALARTLA